MSLDLINNLSLKQYLVIVIIKPNLNYNGITLLFDRIYYSFSLYFLFTAQICSKGN